MHRCACYQYLSGEVHSIGGTAAPTKDPTVTLGFFIFHPKSVEIQKNSESFVCFLKSLE